MDWIINRAPSQDELKVISFGMPPAYGEFFLVWDGEMVDIDIFEIPAAHGEAPTGHRGFWRHPGILAWQPLPTPPNSLKGGLDDLAR